MVRTTHVFRFLCFHIGILLTASESRIRQRVELSALFRELEQATHQEEKPSPFARINQGQDLDDGRWLPELVIISGDACHGILFSEDIVITSKIVLLQH